MLDLADEGPQPSHAQCPTVQRLQGTVDVLGPSFARIINCALEALPVSSLSSISPMLGGAMPEDKASKHSHSINRYGAHLGRWAAGCWPGSCPVVSLSFASKPKLSLFWPLAVVVVCERGVADPTGLLLGALKPSPFLPGQGLVCGLAGGSLTSFNAAAFFGLGLLFGGGGLALLFAALTFGSALGGNAFLLGLCLDLGALCLGSHARLGEKPCCWCWSATSGASCFCEESAFFKRPTAMNLCTLPMFFKELASVVEFQQEAADMMLGPDEPLDFALPSGDLAAVS
ncbi:hypothetical protein PG991_000768 [Apiospora marii]|uniref:Uncharacterized protein n=1 Tax=Apiospora marii TaxID=335849 RepID=A0ABR1SSY5_9PEZI